jgi:hypothetical protein
MAILDAAKAHFAQRRLQVDSVEIPEWNATIYFKPITMKQKMAIYEGSPSIQEICVRSLIYRAIDAEGNALFSAASRVELINQCDPDVIERVALAMFEKEPSQAEAEKK